MLLLCLLFQDSGFMLIKEACQSAVVKSNTAYSIKSYLVVGTPKRFRKSTPSSAAKPL